MASPGANEPRFFFDTLDAAFPPPDGPQPLEML